MSERQLPNANGVFIHPCAVADSDCEIGAGTRIWQFASVVRGAQLGDNVTVASCAIVDAATVGAGSIIGHGASVHPGSLLRDGVFVGPGAVLCNDGWPRVSKDGWSMPTRPTVIVDEGASIGANAVVLPGVHIGAGAMIPAGAICSKDVPPGHILLSNGTCFPIGDESRKTRMRFASDLVETPAWAETIRESAVR